MSTVINRGLRAVVERGVVDGVLLVALPDSNPWGTRFTSLLVRARRSKPEWYSAWGHRIDLLDDALLNQRVRLFWERRDNRSRRIITWFALLAPPTTLRSPRCPCRASVHPRVVSEPPKGF